MSSSWYVCKQSYICMCAKTTTISTERIEAAISVFLKQLDVRKHQELALRSIECNDVFVSLPTGSGKSLLLDAPSCLQHFTRELTPL